MDEGPHASECIKFIEEEPRDEDKGNDSLWLLNELHEMQEKLKVRNTNICITISYKENSGAKMMS